MDKKRKPALEKLFVYGTLKDPEIRQYLFGAIPQPETAVLEEYAVHVNEQGYYFLQPDPGNRTDGLVLSLNQPQLARADQWEEAPQYRREKTRIRMDGRETLCWVYHGDFKSVGKALPGEIAQFSREKVLEEIKKVLLQGWDQL